MTAGAGALAVLIGGGAATVVTLAVGGENTTAARHSTVTEPDLGAPALEDDPEVVSRAAAAAEPLPQRHTAAPTHVTARTVPATTDQLSRARSVDERADRTGPRPARTPVKKEPAERVAPVQAQPPAVAAPVVTTRTDIETREIPFPTRFVRDRSLPRGARHVQSPGAPGEETLRYEVTLTDGTPTGRRLLDTVVTREPEPRVIAFGSRRKGRDCEGRGLRLCMPLGRSAPCPEDGSDEPPAPASAPDEDLELLSPKTLDQVRLEPTTLC